MAKEKAAEKEAKAEESNEEELVEAMEKPAEEIGLMAEGLAGQTPEEALAPAAAETAPAAPKKEDIEIPESHISKQVKSISFSVLSPKLVKDMASAKIVTPELYDKEGYPVDGGLMDIRLGVIDPGLR